MKIVINTCYGGFGLSELAQEEYLKKRPDTKDTFYDKDVARTDPDLVDIVEKLGDKANGWAANLKVVEIPDGTQYVIDEYDGIESIHENHRSWD